MTPERLAAIRALANKDYSVAHEQVLQDTFVGTARLLDALRELVGAFDALRDEAAHEIDRLKVVVGRRGEGISAHIDREAQYIEWLKTAEAERDDLKAQIERLTSECEACGGTGFNNAPSPSSGQCPSCHGEGRVSP